MAQTSGYVDEMVRDIRRTHRWEIFTQVKHWAYLKLHRVSGFY